MSSLHDRAWIAIAELLRPQGRHGELLAEPLSDLPEIFQSGRAVTFAAPSQARPADSAEASLIEEHWFPTGKNAGRVVLKLAGCDTIAQAEALAGQQLMVPADALPALPKDTFYVGDLLGCDLFDGDRRMGRVIDVEFATAPDGRTRLQDAAPLLAVAANEQAGPVLVPFVQAWMDHIDLAAKHIIMHLPLGLFDDAPAENSRALTQPSRPPR